MHNSWFFFSLVDESMEFDPNYDPSDFLPTNGHSIGLDLMRSSYHNHADSTTHNDLKINNSHQKLVRKSSQDTNINTACDYEDLWF